MARRPSGLASYFVRKKQKKKTNKQTNKQTDRQTDRQTDTIQKQTKPHQETEEEKKKKKERKKTKKNEKKKRKKKNETKLRNKKLINTKQKPHTSRASESSSCLVARLARAFGRTVGTRSSEEFCVASEFPGIRQCSSVRQTNSSDCGSDRAQAVHSAECMPLVSQQTPLSGE
jgi:hypothetical protein